MRWYLVYRSFQTEQRDFAAFRRWIMRAAARPRRARQGADESRRKNEVQQKRPGQKTPGDVNGFKTQSAIAF
jgi:LysR family glycine cleavage system transcriptional activator